MKKLQAQEFPLSIIFTEGGNSVEKLIRSRGEKALPVQRVSIQGIMLNKQTNKKRPRGKKGREEIQLY